MHLSLLRADRDDARTQAAYGEGGDRVRLEGIFGRHADTVYRICLSLMGNRPDAEDALQAVFLKLLERWREFSDEEHEKAFLIVAARNHCRDLHRQWWRKKTAGLSPELEAPAFSPEVGVAESLMRLPQKYRLVLYLHYYEGYKVAEIAGLLAQNANTVKTRLRKARERLRIEIGDDDHE